MNVLSKIPRGFLKEFVFIVLLLLYLYGPLEMVASIMPTLWSIPAIFVMSAILSTIIESLLSGQRVESQRKSIFISGCDSGFGFELAKRMSNRGFHVFAGCLLPRGGAARALSKLRSVSIVDFDVTKEEKILKAVATVGEKLSRDGRILWGVVANAGVATYGPFEWSPMREIEQMFDVNVFGTVRTAKAFLPALRESRGRFVVSACLSGLSSFQQLVPYLMGKAALRALTDGLNRELCSSSGVQFSCVLPNFHEALLAKKTPAGEIERMYLGLSESEQKKIQPEVLSKLKRDLEATLMLFTVKELEQTLTSYEHALTSTRPRRHYISERLHLVLSPILSLLSADTTDALCRGIPQIINLSKLFRRKSSASD